MHDEHSQPNPRAPIVTPLFHHASNKGELVRLVVLLITLLSAGIYFSWRITVLNPNAPIFSVIFIFAEGFGFFTLLLSSFTFWRTRPRAVITPPAGMTIDVFITTLNEPIEIVRLTAAAALKMSYPHTTWILDDGDRDEIKSLASSMGCEYLSRKDNTHAKAGNLNNALQHTHGDFILILDADHIPQPWFLEHTLGYFHDSQVALVQTPQDYYTTDTLQFRSTQRKLWHDQTLFYQIGQAGRDFWNATSFCGTNAVLRRSALESIGGIAHETVTEDMHTSIRLQKKGYRTIYHPESLAFGIAATDFVEFLQQRLRWGHGNVQVLREENLPFCKNLTWPQKLCYTSLGVSYFEGWTRLALYLTPAIVLFTGIAPLGDTEHFLWFFIPYFISAITLINVMGRGNSSILQNERLAMARFPVYLLATFGLFIKRSYWRITSKQRGKQIPAYLLLPQITIFTFNVSALFVAIVNPPLPLIDTMSGGTLIIIIFWATYVSWLSGITILDVLLDSQKAHQHSLLLDLPVELISPSSGRLKCRTIKFSADNILVTCENPPDLADITHIKLYLPEGMLKIPAKARTDGVEGSLQITLEWATMDSSDTFHRQMHACTWHRLITHPDTHPVVLGNQPKWDARLANNQEAMQLYLIERNPENPNNVRVILFNTIIQDEKHLLIDEDSKYQYAIKSDDVKILWPGALLCVASRTDGLKPSSNI